jgi:HD-like signal output (HDOD) protein
VLNDSFPNSEQLTMSVTQTNNNLREILRKCQLAALPQSAIRLMELSQNPDNGPEEFTRPLESDPGLTGQILKFVNSSYFGFAREISSVKMAISLVGIKSITNFALWSAVFSLVPNPKCGPFDLKNLWVDSLRRGLFARGFGKQIGLNEAEDLFTAALLQDLAVPFLAKEFSDRYALLLLERAAQGKRLSTLEREAFGWDHAEASGILARLWNLPEKFAALLESHTQLESLLGNPKRDMGRIVVSLSALLPSLSDAQWNDRGHFKAIYRDLAGSKAKLSVNALFAKVDQEYTEIAPVLKLPDPASKLADVVALQPVGGKA